MGGPTFFDLFVTSVEKDRIFLKIWGQKDLSSATSVERMILKNMEAFENDVGVVTPHSVNVGQLCCARFRDGSYYRARILAVDLTSLYVRVAFLDYGNSELLPISTLRVPSKDAEALFNIPPQATSYILSEVTGNWDEHMLATILKDIGYEEHKCIIVSSIGPMKDVHLLKLYHQNRDYAEILCAQGLASYIPLNQFEVVMNNVPPVKTSPMQPLPNFGVMGPYGNQMMNFSNPLWPKMVTNSMAPSFPAFPNSSVPGFPASNPLNSMTNLSFPTSSEASFGIRNPYPKPSNPAISSKKVSFDHNSEHIVTVSFVEDFGNIAVQLKEDEEELLALMAVLNNEDFIPTPLQPPLLPGTKCLGKYSGDGSYCRAVVVGFEGDRCKLYYTDYGNSEVVDCKDIYELPSTVSSIKAMAVQFSLSGLKEVHPTDEMKEIFKEIMKSGENMTLKVCAPKEDESPIKLYCDLFMDDTNVTDQVNVELMKRRSKPKLRPITELASNEDVVVSYVKTLNQFFVQLKSKQSELEELMEQMNEFCKTQADKLQLTEIISGTTCCALYSVDGRWYRASVVDPSMDSLTVSYVDYGNEERVTPDDLRMVDPKWTRLRTQAIHCQLHGFENVDSDALAARFEEIALEQSFRMQVVQSKRLRRETVFIVKLFTQSGEDVATLLQDSSTNKTSVREAKSEIVSNGFVSNKDSVVHHRDAKHDSSRSEWSGKDHSSYDKSYDSRKTTSGENTEASVKRGFKSENFSGEERLRNSGRREKWSEKDNESTSFDKGRPKESDWGSANENTGGKRYYYHCDRTEVDHNEESNYSRNDGRGRTRSDRDSNRGGSRHSHDYGKELNRNDSAIQKGSSNSMSPSEETWGEETTACDLSLTMVRPSIGSGMPVYVVYSSNPSDFYVHARGSDDLTNLMNQMAEEYSSGGEALSISDIKEGAVCVAKYDDDDSWYRAVIKKVNDNSVDVFFPDYGNIQTVNNNELKKIKAEFTTLQGQAIHCSLMGTPSTGWSDDEIASFNQLSESENLEANFVEMCSESLFKVILKDGGSRTINEIYGATPESMLSPVSIVTSIPCQMVAPGSVHEVLVSWFVSPSSFYVQLKSSADSFKSLMGKMQKNYRNKERIYSTEVGQMVVARFKDDNTLYRAQVKVLKGTKFGVRYVDYGNKSLVDDIYGLEHQFAMLPTQAILCSLVGVSPMEEDWPKNSPVICQLLEGDILCTFHGPKPDGVEAVSLTCNGLDIAQQLIEKNLAKSDQPMLTDEVSIEPICLDLLVGQILPCVVTACVGTTLFVIMEPESLLQVQEKVQGLFQSPDKLLKLPSERAVPSQLCIAYFEESQSYKRAKIVDAASTAGILVQCIDDGFVEEVGAASVFDLPVELASLPPQAVECIVSGSENLAELEDGMKALVNQNVILIVQQVEDNKLKVNLLSSSGKPLPYAPCEASPVSICPMPVLRRHMQVCVTHASGVSVWLQQACHSDIISQMLGDLFAVMEEECVPDKWEKKTVCAAKSEDGNWYRGTIEDLTDTEAVISYVDYGNSETVPLQNLGKLPEEFIVGKPAFALKASLPLHCVKDTLSETIMSLTAEKEFSAVLEKSDDHQWWVELLEAGDELSKKLVLSGEATCIEDHPLTTLLKKGTRKLTPGSSANVHVPFVSSASEIYIQLVDRSDDLNKLQADLQTLAFCMKSFDKFPEVGSKCMALYEDGQWYRGRVLPDDRIHFIDYGNVEKINASSLKQLAPAVSQLDDFAVKCCLISPEKMSWSSKTAVRLEELLLEAQDVLVKVLLETPEALHVEITLEGKSVADMLAEEGFLDDLTKSVFISIFSSPADFWTTENDAAVKLEEMDLASGADISDVEQGALCAALFEDGYWYRGLVEAVDEIGCTVRFIDYGNTAVVTQFKSLSAELSSLPPLAKHCCLHLPSHVSQKWSDASIARFSELVAGGTTLFNMNILKDGDPAIVNLSIDGKGIVEELISLCSPSTVAVLDNLPSVSFVKAFVAFANSPSDFYIHLEDDFGTLQQVEEALLDGDNFEDLTVKSPETVCAAKFPDDEKWYRARILAVNNDMFEVIYIDYGNSSTCTELKSLPESLQGPSLAKHCTLPHVDNSSMWTDAAVDKFLELTSDPGTEFQAEFLSRDEPLVTNLELSGHSIVMEVAELSGVDRSAVEQLITALRTSRSADLSKGVEISKVTSLPEHTPDESIKLDTKEHNSAVVESVDLECSKEAVCDVEALVDKTCQSNGDVIDTMHPLPTAENAADEIASVENTQIKETAVSASNVHVFDGPASQIAVEVVEMLSTVEDTSQLESVSAANSGTQISVDESRGTSEEIGHSQLPNSFNISDCYKIELSPTNELDEIAVGGEQEAPAVKILDDSCNQDVFMTLNNPQDFILNTGDVTTDAADSDQESTQTGSTVVENAEAVGESSSACQTVVEKECSSVTCYDSVSQAASPEMPLSLVEFGVSDSCAENSATTMEKSFAQIVCSEEDNIESDSTVSSQLSEENVQNVSCRIEGNPSLQIDVNPSENGTADKSSDELKVQNEAPGSQLVTSSGVLVELLTYPSAEKLLEQSCDVSHGFSRASVLPCEFQNVEPGVVTFKFSECKHILNVEVKTSDTDEDDIGITRTELIASVLLAESDQIMECVKKNVKPEDESTISDIGKE